MVYTINQGENSIDYDRLPWTGTNPDSLEWENAGCLTEIRDNGGQDVTIFLDVTKDLDDPSYGNTLTEKLHTIIDPNNSGFNYEKLLMTYY